MGDEKPKMPQTSSVKINHVTIRENLNLLLTNHLQMYEIYYEKHVMRCV